MRLQWGRRPAGNPREANTMSAGRRDAGSCFSGLFPGAFFPLILVALCLLCFVMPGEENLVFAEEQGAPATGRQPSGPRLPPSPLRATRPFPRRPSGKSCSPGRRRLFSSENSDYVADRFAGDIERIVSLYRSAGYYDATVKSRIAEEQGENTPSACNWTSARGSRCGLPLSRLNPRFWPAWLMAGLQAKGGEERPQQAKVRAAADFPLLPLHVGDILDVARYNDAKKMLAVAFCRSWLCPGRGAGQ